MKIPRLMVSRRIYEHENLPPGQYELSRPIVVQVLAAFIVIHRRENVENCRFKSLPNSSQTRTTFTALNVWKDSLRNAAEDPRK